MQAWKADVIWKHGKQMLYASMENRCYMQAWKTDVIR